MFRIKNKDLFIDNIIAVITIIITLLFLAPYLYLFFSSIKPPQSVFSSPPSFFPNEFSLMNYINAIGTDSIVKFFTNSIIIAVLSTMISVLIGALAAYSISRFKLKILNIFLVCALITRMIPLTSIAVPIYRIVSNLGMRDSRLALGAVYISINLPLIIWMMVSFFESIPRELDEAALIDGCNRLEAFFKIILPLTLPGLATTSIFSFMLSWNDFLFALLLTSNNAKTVPVALSDFLSVYNLQLGTMAAVAILFSLPVMIFTFLVQKHIVAGLTLGSVKG
ncbi:carbohydrate ABC transporter membrane protein 2 (CUT1 family) [Halanaerobium saccharolyticum]|uniref:Carbohydrate ABC transporter membrane protein 2 (CUT1 family) n=1 Tax=Halanaerobium saccharolyticum TaxID=43595 RepID=A0A4V6Q7Z0_9FIRM|nr:carbohydrate ABC transporter permease [Halanaerobium saccharolyticum]RAK03949.1 carbohydrate ABC transporter membrane protein 2 (CUT1 family) [Halanaerobium saccharolyticum]TDV97107.1 carbohydrate ABC transporter membrane protein 2 (CUT1 family) [Halanaerobium saccharolyticum]TDX49039.1 carbohydrate ABC transporter membrane protein 2 (CUT1 family) [Halanaerobium saccharolyticum]